MVNKRYLFLYILLSVIPIIITAFVYPTLPDLIPTHFYGEIASTTTSKTAIWHMTMCIFAFNMVILCVLATYLFFSKNEINPLNVKLSLEIISALAILLDVVSIDIIFARANFASSNSLVIMIIGGICVAVYAIIQSMRINGQKRG